MQADADLEVAAAAVAAHDVAGLAALARLGNDPVVLTLPGQHGPRSVLEAVLETGDPVFVAGVLAIPGVSAARALPAHGFWRWAQGASLPLVRAFLAGSGVDPGRSDADGMTLLHELASGGAAPGVVTWLLDRVPADPRAQDGSTPLAHALGRGDLELAQELRRRGADLNVPSAWTGWTPLVTAVVGGTTDVVSWLLACDEVDVNRADATGATPLHHASRLGRVDVIDALLERTDLDPVAQDDQGRTALIDGARHGRLDVVAALLRHPDPGVDLADVTGRTALDYATDGCAPAVVDALRSRSAHPGTPGPVQRGAEGSTGPIEVAIGDPPMEE